MTLKFNTRTKLLLLGFVIKVLLFVFFISNTNLLKPIDLSDGLSLKEIPFVTTYDYEEFIAPCNNYVEHGNYAQVATEKAYAGRMPGLVFPYLFFRFVFSEPIALSLLVLFTLCCSVVAAYYFSKLVESISANKKIGLIAFLLYLLLPFYWFWDFATHPNSMAVSAYVFHVYTLHIFFKHNKLKHLLLSGFFVACVFFMRPFTFLFLPIGASMILYNYRKQSLKMLLKYSIIFVFPFVFFESIWIVRNYKAFDKFIPLQTAFAPGSGNEQFNDYSKTSSTKYSLLKVRELIDVWGGDNVWYFKNSEMGFFMNPNESEADAYVFKNYVYSNYCTRDSLNALRKNIVNSIHGNYSEEEQNRLEQKIINQAERFKNAYLQENKFYHYCIAPFLRLNNFLVRNVVQDWPIQSFEKLSLFAKALKLYSLALYAIVMLSIALILLNIKKLSVLEMLISLNAFAIICSFMFLINFAHFSYAILPYVSFLLLLLIAVGRKTKV